MGIQQLCNSRCHISSLFIHFFSFLFSLFCCIFLQSFSDFFYLFFFSLSYLIFLFLSFPPLFMFTFVSFLLLFSLSFLSFYLPPNLSFSLYLLKDCNYLENLLFSLASSIFGTIIFLWNIFSLWLLLSTYIDTVASRSKTLQKKKKLGDDIWMCFLPFQKLVEIICHKNRLILPNKINVKNKVFLPTLKKLHKTVTIINYSNLTISQICWFQQNVL